MADILNLNKARKAKTRTDNTVKAEENRVKFGRTKAEKDLEAAQADQAARRLDAHRRDGEAE